MRPDLLLCLLLELTESAHALAVFHRTRCGDHQALDYLARKQSEGHSPKEARRAHKTLLGRRVIRRMWTDRRRQLEPTPKAA